MSSYQAVVRALGMLLIGVALVGKLAFITLSKQQAYDPAALLQKGEGLQATLDHLKAERSALTHKIQAVDRAEAVRRERKQALRHEAEERKEDAARKVEQDKSELAAERQFKSTLETGLDKIRGLGTRTDESLFNLIMHDHNEEQHLLRQQASRAEKQAVTKQKHEEVQIEAKLEAKEELRKEGLIPKAKKVKQAKTVLPHHESLRTMQEKVRNDALAAENKDLSKEIKDMRLKLKLHKELEAKEKRAMYGGSDTFGSQLAKAGVVTDSWGPMTSDAGTKPDPRDTFAKEPNSMKPKPVKPFHMPSIKAPKTEGQLEKELGFKSSILYSNSFNKAW